MQLRFKSGLHFFTFCYNMKYITILAFLFLTIIDCDAQETFNRRYHFGAATLMTGISVSDSAYYGVGIYVDTMLNYKTSNFFTKFNLQGDIEFTKFVANSEKTYQIWESDLIKTNSGGFAAVGFSYENERTGFLINYKSDGDTLFLKEFISPYHMINELNVPTGVIQTNENEFISTQIVNNGQPKREAALAKFDAQGDMIWQRTYGDELNLHSHSICLSDDGSIYIGGVTTNLNPANNNFKAHAKIIKLDTAGVILSEYESPQEWGLIGAVRGIIPAEDGGLVLATGKGEEIQVNSNSGELVWNPWVFKLDENMELEWEVYVGSPSYAAGSHLINSMIETNDGSGYICVGSYYDSLQVVNQFGNHGFIAKVSPSGELLWKRLYHGVEAFNNSHPFFEVEETVDGGFLLCGESKNQMVAESGEVRQQGWLVKLDEHGCLVPGCHLIDDVVEISIDTPITIYPNPVRDYLNIYVGDISIQDRLEFKLVDVSGQVVKSFVSSASDITHLLPVYDLPVGIYFLSVWDGSETVFSEKIVVQN